MSETTVQGLDLRAISERYEMYRVSPAGLVARKDAFIDKVRLQAATGAVLR